ncbi:hypothetical protein MNBD_GAMMA01-1244 [hydrothermal vent metagenome]|uniref:Organic solvent tolerance-like N-terminal domain-containing protein n=1 Tax=hydrothermal vent metagenome TaxID=652676 RepID=A0A3B0VL80_9ZZZZ
MLRQFIRQSVKITNKSMALLYPNPDIEMRSKMQVIDVHRKSQKTKVTSLVMRLFLGFLSASRTCAIIIFSILGLGLSLILISTSTLATDVDQQADFILEGDNCNNLPEVINGVTKVRCWDNVSIAQGSLKIKADDAVIFNSKKGITKVVLTGNPVTMEKFIDAEFGKIDVSAKKIDFMVQDDLLFMTGDVLIKSKIQGEMSGEKISMNLKTKEIKGEKSNNERVRLVIKPSTKADTQ